MLVRSFYGMDDRDLKEREPSTEKVFLEVLRILNEEPYLDREAQERVLKRVYFLLKGFYGDFEDESLAKMGQELYKQLEKAAKYNELLIETLNQLLSLLDLLIREGSDPVDAGKA